MKQKLDLTSYNSIVFIDSMVVLEGNPLDQQRWSDIDEKGPILVFVVPQVAREIDKRKRDGRLAVHARAFNRLMEPTALSGRPESIVQSSPRVDICLATPSRINWDVFDELDPEDSDAKVVIQVLKSSEVFRGRGVFLSQDIYPISIASRYGIKT